MQKLSKKGSILIAMVFVIVLSLTTISYIIMVSGRSAFSANQLKRAQAINCAEAALYETFNRIRAGTVTPQTWTPNTIINVPVADPANPATTYNVGVSVTITGASAPFNVDATVNLNNIRM